MNQINDNTSADSLVLGVFKAVFKPLVKVLIRGGVTLPILVSQIKQLYVEVAREELQDDGKPPTVSQISVTTGVHRKDVTKLLDFTQEDGSHKLSFIASVFAAWRALASDSCNKTLLPIPVSKSTKDILSELGVCDSLPSFEEISTNVSKDVRSRSVLNEMIRRDLVYVDDNHIVHPKQSSISWKNETNDQLFYLRENLSDHISAATHNFHKGDEIMPCERFLDQAFYIDGIQPEALAHLRQISRIKSMAMLSDFASIAKNYRVQDDKKNSVSFRFRLGVYSYDKNNKSPKIES